jgi:hypothetical protein
MKPSPRFSPISAFNKGTALPCRPVHAPAQPGATFTTVMATPPGVATLKITASAYVDNAVVSHSVYLTVNVLAPQFAP